MNSNTAIKVIVVGTGLLVIALVFFLIFGFRVQEDAYETSTGSILQNTTTTPSTTGSSSPFTTSDMEVGQTETTDTQAEYAACVAKEKSKVTAGGIQYSKGALLVSFPVSTNFTQASMVVSEYGLSLFSMSEAQQTFSTSHWFKVKVPSGKEFDWMCTLRGDIRVKYVAIEPILQLNQ